MAQDGPPILLIVLVAAAVVVAIVLLFVAKGQRSDAWRAGATAFATAHPTLAVEQRRTADLAPFAKTYEVLTGTWHDWPVSVQRTARPSSTSRQETQTTFSCGPDPRWPAGVVIARRLVSRGDTFEGTYAVEQGDRDQVAAWLTPARQQAIAAVGANDASLHLTARYGVTVVRQGTGTDPAWLTSGLDTVTWLARQLA